MICIIPARGGSKGIPHKNIKKLNGKPLIAYTIEAARNSGVFERIIVSTDDSNIAEVSEAYGAEIPFIRPKSISGDSVSSDEAVSHAVHFLLSKGEVYENVCKLQATSPLRTSNDIKLAYRAFIDKHYNYLVSVCECEHSPLWTGRLGDNNEMDSFINSAIKANCRQKLATFYRLNGAIYMAKVSKFLQDGDFFGEGCFAFLMSQEHSIDIDTILDFQIAQYLLLINDQGNGIMTD